MLHVVSKPMNWFQVMGLLSACSLAGCGPNDAPRLARAKSVVTFNGKPLPNIGVTFFPTGAGPMAIGETNEKGEFVMMTRPPLPETAETGRGGEKLIVFAKIHDISILE